MESVIQSFGGFVNGQSRSSRFPE